MEFIICMLLASLLTGGRLASDLVHAAKGTTPPHVEKARLKAERQPKTAKQRSPYADGKPRLRDVAATYWGDAMADAIASHNRRRAEKAQQRAENRQATADRRPAKNVRPPLKQRAKRVWDLLIQPVGERKGNEPAELNTPQLVDDDFGPMTSPVTHPEEEDLEPKDPPRSAAADTPGNPQAPHANPTRPAPARPQPVRGTRTRPTGDPMTPPRDSSETDGRISDAQKQAWAHEMLGADHVVDPARCPHCAEDERQQQREKQTRTHTEETPMTAPTGNATTGEVVNYETAMAELDAIEAAERIHLEHAQAALANVQGAKAEIGDTQGTYRPAAEAAGLAHQSLAALNLDQQTVANTGTIADAMPPNDVDVMFDQLEGMEAKIQQQVTNAEMALAAVEAARQTIVAKYGDAHATVQGELSGDSRFLGDGQGAGYATSAYQS